MNLSKLYNYHLTLIPLKPLESLNSSQIFDVFSKTVTRDLISKNSQHPLILAISGGVDSMALLNYFTTFNTSYKLIVVNFNHQVREQSLLEDAYLNKFCQENSLTYINIKIPLLQANNSTNFQGYARDLRIKHLIHIAKQHHTTLILTAHHLNDLTETILQRFSKGSTLSGYAGLHYINQIQHHDDSYYFIKPFLYTPKETIIEYTKTNNIVFFEDYSNLSPKYQRNRIRHQQIPLIKQENSSFLEATLLFHFQLENAHYKQLDFFSKYYFDNILNLKEFIKLNKVDQTSLLTHILNTKNISPSKGQIYEIMKIINSNKPNIIYPMSNGLKLQKQYHLLVFDTKILKTQPLSPVLLEIGHEICYFNTFFLISTNIIKNAINSQVLCYNNIKYPLVLRTRKPGDIIKLPYGSKKVKDFFIDRKIPLKKRDILLILSDQNNTILWIEDLYINQCLGSDKKLFINWGTTSWIKT